MKYFAISFSLIFLFCNQCDIRPLTDAEKIARLENKQFYDWKTLPVFDTAGVQITLDEVNTYSPEKYIFEEFVDCNDQIVKLQIRQRRESDLALKAAYDSIYTNNLDIKIASLKFTEKDSVKLKQAIENAKYLAPFEYENINCNDVCALLDAVLESDQSTRIHGEMSLEADRNNLIKIESIIHHCSWSSIEACGQDGVNAAFYTIQHAQPEYRIKHLNKFIELSQSGLIRKSTLALMIDRTRTDNKQKQLYGTQYKEERNSGRRILHDLEDPVNVDSLRREMDLEPLIYYLKAHNIERVD